VNRTIDDRPGIQQEAICYQWFKQRLILSVSKPSISQRSQIIEDTVEPSVPAREFTLKAYAAITWHNDPASLGLELRLTDHRSQAARTATLPTAPPRQAAELLHDQPLRWVTMYSVKFVCRWSLYVNMANRSAFIIPYIQSPQITAASSWSIKCFIAYIVSKNRTATINMT